MLIIDILSSVALPQYQKAVLKSRAAEAWTNLKNLNMAVSAYCLEGGADGTLAAVKDQLSIEVNNSKNFAYTGTIGCNSVTNYIQAEWQGSNNYDFKLGIQPKTGRRSCQGTNCSDIGFTKFSSDSVNICLCGAGGSCYYAD